MFSSLDVLGALVCGGILGLRRGGWSDGMKVRPFFLVNLHWVAKMSTMWNHMLTF